MEITIDSPNKILIKDNNNSNNNDNRIINKDSNKDLNNKTNKINKGNFNHSLGKVQDKDNNNKVLDNKDKCLRIFNSLFKAFLSIKEHNNSKQHFRSLIILDHNKEINKEVNNNNNNLKILLQ